MDVVVIESEAYKQLMAKIENLEKLFVETAEQLKDKTRDRWLTIFEVAEFTGFSRAWVYHRKDDIGFFQQGKDLRFWMPNVLFYMEERAIAPSGKSPFGLKKRTLPKLM